MDHFFKPRLTIYRIGDFLEVILALHIVWDCRRIDGGLPKFVQVQMFWNIVQDLILGLVPFIGDFADMLFRANTRNDLLLYNCLEKKYNPSRKRPILLHSV
jgi:hypothetical protein